MKKWQKLLLVSFLLLLGMVIFNFYGLFFFKINMVILLVSSFFLLIVGGIIFHSAYSYYEKESQKTLLGEQVFKRYRNKLQETISKRNQNILSIEQISTLKQKKALKDNTINKPVINLKDFVHQKILSTTITVAQKDFKQNLVLREQNNKLILTYEKKDFLIDKLKSLYQDGVYLFERIGSYQEKPIFNYLLVNNKVFRFHGVYGKTDLVKEENYVVYNKLFYTEVDPPIFLLAIQE